MELVFYFPNYILGIDLLSIPIVVRGPLGLLRLSLSLQLNFSRGLLLLKFTDRDCTFKDALGVDLDS